MADWFGLSLAFLMALQATSFTGFAMLELAKAFAPQKEILEG